MGEWVELLLAGKYGLPGKSKAFVLGAPPQAGCAWVFGTRKKGFAFFIFPRISSWATLGHASGVLGQHAYLVDPPRRACSRLQGRSTPKPTSFDHRGHEGTQRKAKEKTKTPPGLPQGVQRRCHTCMVGSRWVNGWNCCSRENTELQEKGKGIRFGRSSGERDARGPFDSPTLWDHLEGRLFGREEKIMSPRWGFRRFVRIIPTACAVG